MLTSTGGIVLFVAPLHASWDAMLHGNRDRFLSMTWMSIAIAAVSILVGLFSPWPASASWPYIVASGLVHIFYNVSLVRSYRRNDLALAYPIARGSSPLLVTLGAALFAHEAIGLLHTLGIALRGHHVSRAGAMGRYRRRARTSVVFAVLIGRMFLREAVSGTRWLACVVVVAGAVCLGL